MSETAGQSFEISREKYKDFRDMLSDSHLSDEEKTELQQSYNYECSEIQEETTDLCSELQKEIDAYNEIKNMSQNQIQQLQILSGTPKNQVDGLRWPNTFAYYLSTISNITDFSTLSPSELVERYEQIFSHFKDAFNALDEEQRMNIQESIGTWIDGKFWPNTFGKIFENLQSSEDLRNIFFEPSQVRIASENEEHMIQEAYGEDVRATESEEESETEIDIEEGDQEAVTNNVELTSEELKEKLIEESEWTHRVLIRMLQQAIWTTDDGDFWPNSAQTAIETHPNISSFTELMEQAWIPLESDGLLEGWANMEIWQESFREQYGEFSSILESNFNLPSGLIEAIIAQETKYGAWKLMSPSGCKWMMQLSNNAFDDMKTQYRGNIRNYRESFRNMELDRILAVSIDNGESTIWKSIPSPMIEHLRTLNNPETTNSEHNEAISALQNFIKWDSSYFNHAVNMIIGAVYLSGTYHGSEWGQDITRTADHYNAAAGERVAYRRHVTGFYNQIQTDWYYNQFE